AVAARRVRPRRVRTRLSRQSTQLTERHGPARSSAPPPPPYERHHRPDDPHGRRDTAAPLSDLCLRRVRDEGPPGPRAIGLLIFWRACDLDVRALHIG